MAMPALLMRTSSVSTSSTAHWICEPLVTSSVRGVTRSSGCCRALRRGAKKVYAGTRGALQHPDERVTPLTLDVTNGSQIQWAVDEVDTLDVLINNAGIAIYDDLSNLDVL